MSVEAGDIVWLILGDDEGLNKALDGAKKKAEVSFANMSRTAGYAMTAIGGAITGVMTAAVWKATSFGTAMAEVASLGVKDLGALEEAVKDVSSEFGLELVDAAKAAYQAISAGASEAQTPKLLAEAAKAATAGVSDLTTAIELGAGMSNAFGTSIDDVSVIFDQALIAVNKGVTTFSELGASLGKLAPSFVAAKLSSAEMFASVAALTKGNIATAESVTMLRAVVAGFTRQGESAKLETLGLQGAMQWLMETTGGNQQQMLEFLGSTEALTAVLSLTGTQAQTFTDILGQTQNATGATQAAFDAIVANDPGFAWRQLKAEISVLLVEIGQALIPMLSRLVGFIKPVVAAVTDWIRAHPELAAGIAMAVAAIGALLMVLGPLFIALPGIIALVGGLLTPVGAVAAAIGVALVAAVAAAYAVFKDKWPQIKEAVVPVLSDIWDAMKAVGALFIEAWPLISLAIQMAWMAAKPWLELFMGGLQRLAQFIGWVADQLAKLPDWAFAFFGGGGQNQGTGLASGGTVHQSGWAIVGERGPELVNLPARSTVYDAEQSRAAMSGPGGNAPQVNITNHFGRDSVRSDRDIMEIERRIAENVRRDLRGYGFT